jgi:integration host factor subunit alpha
MTVTKKQLTEAIHHQTGIPKSKSFDIVETVIEMMISALENDDDVLISGFGKFCVKEKQERRGRNPATEASMMLPARKVVTFKCSRTLREKVNGE